ncbi:MULTISPECIES: MBL fold metallo-hydrolase [Pseudovibrio]|uniref:MBL fold metallo-hydrolase n=1 Tax=Stappiaceae TaxID=2821832 RepID=UPI002366E210|nr:MULTISPECIES: MBL fold metallo-hydrolase [Pseudovibrio]MDD7911176.1 MBL fold metallo-hydrolase [Pseudovibrio exalbescens]MDX5593137.1 MBL fold metallo-hydrolase [Pseudovibrio sp. SPO723]
MTELTFDRDFDPAYGSAVQVAPRVQRVTCQNPSPLTFFGTNSYLIGENEVAVLDPGPENDDHLAALLSAIGGRPVKAILVSHTHVDHSPLSRKLQAKTKAPIFGCPPHMRAEAFSDMPENPMEASADLDYQPDRILGEGERFHVDSLELEVVPTPGHTVNHLAFALTEQDLLFPADHVMAWATTVVAPPDGAMGLYMNSIERLLERPERRYLPAHGGEIAKAHQYLEGLRAHRLSREAAIIERLKAGDKTIPEMVEVIYADVARNLHGAAALNVLAHLEELCARGEVDCEGPISLESYYRFLA